MSSPFHLSIIPPQVIIREFCPLRPNWALVSDIFSSGSAMRGVYRRWEHCKQRWEVLRARPATHAFSRLPACLSPAHLARTNPGC